MPNRIIKESIITSETLAELTGDEERLFWRLIVLADDYGRYHGDPALIRPLCFPRTIEQVPLSLFESWFNRLQEVGLIRCYESDGKRYLMIATWDKHQQRRAKKSKFPQPPEDELRSHHLMSSDINCNQMKSDDSDGLHMSPYSYSYSRIENRESSSGIKADDDKKTNQPFTKTFAEVFGAQWLTPTMAEILNPFVDEMSEEVVNAAIERSKKHNPGNPVTYVERVLMRWQKAGIKNLADVEKLDAEFENRKQLRNKDSPTANEWADLKNREVIT